jgi:hypothetical protein
MQAAPVAPRLSMEPKAMAMHALTRALKSFEWLTPRVRIGRAEQVASGLIVAILAGVWLAHGAPRKAGPADTAASAVMAAKAKTAAPPQAASASGILAPKRNDKPFIPDKEHRSLETVFALLRATHWGESFGRDEESEELLYAQNMFADGAYVAESGIFKGYYCLIAGGEDRCEPDTIASAAFTASDSKANAIGIRDLASAADFNAAFAEIQENIRRTPEGLSANEQPGQPVAPTGKQSTDGAR